MAASSNMQKGIQGISPQQFKEFKESRQPRIADSIALGDNVEKIKGTGKGTRGTVTAIEGTKIRVLQSNQVSFKLQSRKNFKLVAKESMPPSAPGKASGDSEGGARGEDAANWNDPPSPASAASNSSYVSLRDPPNLLNLFCSQHELTVCCWNSLKLGFVEDASKSSLLEQCAYRLAVELQSDVIMLSEVSKTVGRRRVDLLKTALELASGATYQVRFSELSGVGPANTQPEYHAALVKEGITIEAAVTHHSSAQTKNDHAPYTVFLLDERFADAAAKRIAVTSVHFPPRNRPRDQFVQTRQFFKAYEQQLDWAKELKRRRPFNFGGLQREFCTHLIGGDFNMNPEEIKLSPASWHVLFDEATETSSGRQSYDNFVVNAPATNVFLDISKNMGGFPLSHSGAALSDHDAMLVTLRERVHHRIV